MEGPDISLQGFRVLSWLVAVRTIVFEVEMGLHMGFDFTFVSYSFHNSCNSILFCPESLWIWSCSGSGAPPALEQKQELLVDGFWRVVVRVNVHSQSCAGLLCRSTVTTLVDKPWKVDFCVPPDPCLVLITEPTLQGTVGKNRPRSYR